MATNTETMSIPVHCPICTLTSTVTVKASEYRAWQDGALAQRAFPNMDAGTREMLISGVCPPCWDKMFD